MSQSEKARRYAELTENLEWAIAQVKRCESAGEMAEARKWLRIVGNMSRSRAEVYDALVTE